MTIFKQGHLVGDYAKKWFPGGIEIDHGKAPKHGGIDSTKALLAKRVPIFEAAISFKHCYFRADILEPSGKDEWNIIEVKSSTDIKDINYQDVGFQYYTCINAGIKLNKCYLMCINNKYVRKGKIDPHKLFKQIDITDKVKTKFSKLVEKNVADMLKTISAPKCPEICIGPHCNDPYGCSLTEKCRSFLPERNVLLLYRNKELAFALIKEGVLELANVPLTPTLSPKGEGVLKPALNKSNHIQIRCEKEGKPNIERDELKKFLDTIKYPAHYMDFETWMSAIPKFNGARPYEQIPFQFSVHVVKKHGASPENYSFIADGTGDPRPEFMKELKETIGPKGSIVVYNATFEKGRLKECAQAYPEYKKWVDSLEERFIDLKVPFQAFAYYHPRQNGSCSLKQVLPTLTNRSYSGMEIGNGGKASREYFRVTFTDDNKDKAKVRKLLEEYCGLDTLAMVEIVNALACHCEP